MNFLAQKRSKILLQNGESHNSQPPVSVSQSNFYYKELAKLSASGGWNIDFRQKTTTLSAEARQILEIPENFRTGFKTALDFYAEESKSEASELFRKCSEGQPFNAVLRMQSFQKRLFWGRTIGRPIFNDKEEITGIYGIIQDISKEKQQELESLRTDQIIESQNAKLNNFSNIIAHSLRSHAGNLEMTLELMKEAGNHEEKEELCNGLFEISESIKNTINHLSALSAIQTITKLPLETVDFKDVLEKVKRGIRPVLTETRSEIYSDFSEVPAIKYYPSYMESIMVNLITNAIKYRHPDRSPVIEIYSILENDNPCLLVKDNGMGIDLDSYGKRIFNIYETFHNNKNAEGVGLFLLKNKVESLQGTIDVQSEVNKGTTFIVRF